MLVLDKTNQLIDWITYDMIEYLMEDNNMTMTDAMDTVYKSHTFELLCDLSTHFYTESSGYVYEYLKEELNK